MGTWGFNSFENDNASDWIWGLKPAKKSLLGKIKDPFAYPMSAINQLLRSDLYLESSECDEAIAAAECLAAANGYPPATPPEEIPAWIESLKGNRPELSMLERAAQAVTKTRDDEQSESRELWSESNDDASPDPEWLAAIDDLLDRLAKPPA